MKIKIIEPVVIGGYPGVKVGDVLEVPDVLAHGLINVHYAVEWLDKIEVREPVVENRDPQPVRRGRKTLP
jgi:hypothetical protein